MHPALEALRQATIGTSFEGDLWLVGGAVRDELLGIAHENDFDLVTRGSSAELAQMLFEKEVSSIPPVTYERFGTAMIRVEHVDVEIVTARRESYRQGSRKPAVEPATYEEDSARRDFTINTLMRGLHSGEHYDPLGTGLDDLRARALRTPLDPDETFHDDPLRMLRAVRFRCRLGFTPAPGLYASISRCVPRLEIVSAERIRDEIVKMILDPSGPEALQDRMELGILEAVMPELLPMLGCEQGRYHHLDVWRHSLLVMQMCGPGDMVLALASLLHDVGKPATRSIDADGNVRFYSHETVGAEIARTVLRRLRFPERDIDQIAALVKNHMRLGSSPTFTASAARRVIRDLGEQTDRLLRLAEADTKALKPGVKVMRLDAIRDQLDRVLLATPHETLQSPLSGFEIMALLGIEAGPEIGRLKAALTELVLDGKLAPGDKTGAEAELRRLRGIV